MLIAADNPSTPEPAGASGGCQGLELSWLVRENGSVAAHHTLRALTDGADALLRQAALPDWSATLSPWASALRWSTEVLPRVLRRTDPCAERLGVTDTAAALVILERGGGAAGVSVEHELIVLARFADRVLPSARAGDLVRVR